MERDTEFLVQKIRTQYTEKQHTDLDALKALDASVKRPANVFACLFGTLSALIMGAGMSLVMTELGTVLGISDSLPIGIAVGILGLVLALVNYPLYKAVLNRRKQKFAPQILALSEKLMEH